MNDPQPSLALLVPVYNEAHRLREAIASIDDAGLPAGIGRRWIVLVDDGSTDGTREIARELAGSREDVALVLHAHNMGKGAAVRTGFAVACKGNDDLPGADIVMIHDADLEYDPRDHGRVVAPIVEGKADAVIGSRFIGETHRVLYYWHSVANKVITLSSNMLTNLNLTDIECGTKAFTREVASRLDLRENRFGIEPEIIASLARMRIDGAPLRIYELPVSYAGRTYAEGKKIGWRDGVRALWVIARCAVRG